MIKRVFILYKNTKFHHGSFLIEAYSKICLKIPGEKFINSRNKSIPENKSEEWGVRKVSYLPENPGKIRITKCRFQHMQGAILLSATRRQRYNK